MLVKVALLFLVMAWFQEVLQRVCCGFLICKRAFHLRVPSDFLAQEWPDIEKAWVPQFTIGDWGSIHRQRFSWIWSQLRFMLRHLDTELSNLLENTVPPVDLLAVSVFRMSLNKLAKQACKSFVIIAQSFFWKFALRIIDLQHWVRWRMITIKQLRSLQHSRYHLLRSLDKHGLKLVHRSSLGLKVGGWSGSSILSPNGRKDQSRFATFDGLCGRTAIAQWPSGRFTVSSDVFWKAYNTHS